MEYRTQGVCASAINFEVTEGKVHGVSFIGGCNGNTQGIAKLVENMPVEDVITRLEGIKCGFKSTSCPDQLAKALKAYVTK